MSDTRSQSHSSALELTTSALLAALLASSALVAVTIGAVPLTMQTLVLALIALTQRPGRAALSVGVYLAAGLVGLPVFSGMRGGFGVVLGPTGGYLLGSWPARSRAHGCASACSLRWRGAWSLTPLRRSR